MELQQNYEKKNTGIMHIVGLGPSIFSFTTKDQSFIMMVRLRRLLLTELIDSEQDV